MKRGDRIGKRLTMAALGLALAGSTALAQQTIERDTTITGPKGRSIQRDVKIQRGPGYVDRDITIKRPSGTFQRDTRIVGGRPVGPLPGFRGPGFGPRPVIVENFVGPPAVGLFGLGVGPVFNFGFGGGGPLFGPPPVVVPPPNVVVQPPNRYAPPSTVVVDPVAQALDRLKSFHAHSRRDACLTLGKLGDNRALPALTEKVEKDFDKEVRQAAAWALGEIGDPKAEMALQKAILYDHKHEVRDVAQVAIKKLGRAPRRAPRIRLRDRGRRPPRRSCPTGRPRRSTPRPRVRPARCPSPASTRLRKARPGLGPRQPAGARLPRLRNPIRSGTCRRPTRRGRLFAGRARNRALRRPSP